MTPETVITMGRQAVEVLLMIAAPMLLAALAIGLLVSIFQAATQINEMTLSFIPKLLAMCGVLVLLGPWLIGLMVDYIRQLIGQIPGLVS